MLGDRLEVVRCLPYPFELHLLTAAPVHGPNELLRVRMKYLTPSAPNSFHSVIAGFGSASLAGTTVVYILGRVLIPPVGVTELALPFAVEVEVANIAGEVNAAIADVEVAVTVMVTQEVVMAVTVAGVTVTGGKLAVTIAADEIDRTECKDPVKRSR